MIWWTVWVDRLGSWVACWLVKGWMTSWASLASLTLVHVCNDLPRNRNEGRHLKSSDNVHSDPWCRDRYEGQLNEFLLENKNLKEQLTTLQVLCSKNEDTKSDKFQSQDVEGELAGAKEEVRGALGLKEELNSQLASAKAKQGSLETEVSRWTTKLNQVQFQDLRHDLGPNVWCFLPSSVMCFMQSRICLLQFISEFKRIFPLTVWHAPLFLKQFLHTKNWILKDSKEIKPFISASFLTIQLISQHLSFWCQLPST